MKKFALLLTLVCAIAFANAQTAGNQQNVKTATPVLKVDQQVNNNFVAPKAETGSKTTTSSTTSTNSAAQKSCMSASTDGSTPAGCVGKTSSSCNHDEKSCSKASSGSTTTPACCQKGSGSGCSHGGAAKPE